MATKNSSKAKPTKSRKSSVAPLTEPVRHGDLVVHPVERESLEGRKRRPGNVLAAGDSTSLKHTFVPATAGKQYEGEHGTVLLRLTKPAKLTHDGRDGHQSIALPPGDYVCTRKRQYDREHGWTTVAD